MRPLDGWNFTAMDRGDSFVLIANLGRRVARATFFPLEESQVDNSAPQAMLPIATGFRLTLQKSDQLLKPIKLLRGVLELSPGTAYVIEAAVQNGNAVR
jgi:hypothetical protein